jgi:hypothetical protein
VTKKVVGVFVRFRAPLLLLILQDLQTKIESILAYGSQFYDKDSKEPESPITSKTS